MRDFVKTMDFVAKLNDLADDVNKCVFADQSTNRSLIEQWYMLYGDDAFNSPPRTMGEWELEQFEQTTNKLEKELKELPGELVELCPTMADMPQYFSVWTNILKRMVRHDVEWWTEHESLSFWENQGVMERAQFDCALAVSSLHSLNDAVQRMIADVLEKYAINAPQSQATAQAEQLATEDVKGRLREKYGAYIKDVDAFFGRLETMDNKDVATYHKRHLSKSSVTLKEFVHDILSIIPERKGEKGWNYEAIRKH